jgi:hypothetical protein
MSLRLLIRTLRIVCAFGGSDGIGRSCDGIVNAIGKALFGLGRTVRWGGGRVRIAAVREPRAEGTDGAEDRIAFGQPSCT